MELTPKLLIEDVDFPHVRKGYDPDEVHTFLEWVAGGVAQLQRQLAEAREQQADADAGGRIRGEPSGSETGEIQRTLVLAQRTADAAIREAREEAAVVVAEAKVEAARILDGARTAAARRDEEARSRLRGEIERLEGLRESLRGDVTILERHVEEQRLGLRSSLAELQRLLDDPATFRVDAPAGLSGARVGDLVPGTGAEGAAGDRASGPSRAAAPAGSPTADADAGVDAGADADADADDTAADGHLRAGEAARPAGHQGAAGGPAERPTRAGADGDVASSGEAVDRAAMPDGTEPAGGSERRERGRGARGEAAPVVIDAPTAAPQLVTPVAEASGLGARGEEAFLAELREAMAEDEPVGSLSGSRRVGGPAPAGADDRRRARFGRRR
ncbi:MAG: DivIVA domain-containing protein [Actinobacteria bacterium]|nr:DivIVA domain-containing protein [Actinomycetota bacterium]